MSLLELVSDRAGHVIEGEQRAFFRDTRLEDDLKQQITKLIAQVTHITALDSVGDFVGFLDSVRDYRREGLLAIPFAAIGATQDSHNGEKAVDLASH
ncbi:hypothetical protein GCM10011515_10320 [Tsuneonella deserti]|uniref:Uncharacterized protein n=1 Tax=Tsuneonella deserti TaxID=2035528 RepID=A0ABQ1S6K0_9SPHN|nr:hypothetical protein GCM10011515_10320 [Tsuneonella deserti]